ncbi:PREDICTED: sporulation-specific protein 15-like [Nicrophorus vespilloides]|uniref:Sporulation-specific protein 15-like n=1 Tax=Nicrophorus vespilloides TaxID=110193 RepID=A0ABM1M3L9_NICVS|nr:PREDICTED: sporulation-specific protein 15-like [Nicrophorus vespilloides]
MLHLLTADFKCYKLVKNKLKTYVENRTELESYLRKYDEFEVALLKLQNETQVLLLHSQIKKSTVVNNVDELVKNLTRIERKLSESLKYFAQDKSIDLEEMEKEINDIEKTLKTFKIPDEDVPTLDVHKKITEKLNKVSKDQFFINKNLKNVGKLLKEVANNNKSLQGKLGEKHEQYEFDLKKASIDEVKKLANESMKNKEFAEYLIEKVKKLQTPSVIFFDIDIEIVQEKINNFTITPEFTTFEEVKKKSEIIENAFDEFSKMYKIYKNAVKDIESSFDESEIMYKKINDELDEAIRLYKEIKKILDDFAKDLVAILENKQKQHDTLSEIIEEQNEDLKKIDDHLDELNTNLKEIEYNDDQLNKCLEEVDDIERYIDDIDSELSKQEESIVALEKELKMLLDFVQIEMEKRSEMTKIQAQVDKIKIIADGIPDMEYETCDQCYKLVKNKLKTYVENRTELESYLRKYDEFEVALLKLQNETQVLLLQSQNEKSTAVNNVDELTKNLMRVERKLSESLKYFAQEKSIDLKEMKKEISNIEKTLKTLKIPEEDVPTLDVHKKITQKLNMISKDQTFINKNLKNVGILLKEIVNNNKSLQEKLGEKREEYDFDLKKASIDEVKKLANESMKNKKFAEYLLEKVKKLQVLELNSHIDSVKEKNTNFIISPELITLDEVKKKSEIIQNAFNEFNEVYMNYKDEVDDIQTSFDESEIFFKKIDEKHDKINKLVKHIKMEIDELDEAIELYEEILTILDDFNEDLVAILENKQKQHDILTEIIEEQNEELMKIEDHLDELNTNLKEIEYNDDQVNKCLEEVDDIERYIDDIDSELSKQEESIVALEKELKMLLDTVQIEMEKKSELENLQVQVDKIKIIADGLPEIECGVQRT